MNHVESLAGAAQDRERLLARSCLGHKVSQVVQHGRRVFEHQRIVVHDEHGQPLRRDGTKVRRLVGRDLFLVRVCDGQPDFGGRSPAGLAEQAERAAGLLGDAPHHGQTESRPFADTFRCEEWLLRPGQNFGVGLDFSNYYLPLSSKVQAGVAYADAKKQGAVLGYGQFVTVALNFLIVAFVLFLVVRAMNALKRKEEAKVDAPTAPALSTEAKLLTEIRDLLSSGRQPSFSTRSDAAE